MKPKFFVIFLFFPVGFGFLYQQRTYFSKTRADTYGVVVFVPRFWRFDTAKENQTQEDLTVEPVQSPPTVSAAGVTQPFDRNGNVESKETSFSKGSPSESADFESEHFRQDEIQESSTPEPSIDQSVVNGTSISHNLFNALNSREMPGNDILKYGNGL